MDGAIGPMWRLLRGVLIVAAIPVMVAAAPDEQRPVRRGYDFLGTVERIDLKKREIVVKGSKRAGQPRHTIRFDAETEIIKSREPFRAEDIRPEMRIWVYLREENGRVSDVARRLTISDPYPDLYGTVESVDVKGGVITISRRYPGSSTDARRQMIRVKVNDETRIRLGGEEIELHDVPTGRRAAITSVRDAQNKTTSLAAKITVYRESKSGKAGGRGRLNRGEEADEADNEP